MVEPQKIKVERVQTGVRIEKRLQVLQVRRVLDDALGEHGVGIVVVRPILRRHPFAVIETRLQTPMHGRRDLG